MRLPLHRLPGAAVLTAGMALVCPAGAALPAPEIAPAQHLQFTPQPGTAWYLDGSADGQTWTQQAGPFFPHANGSPVNHLQPAGAASQFRLRYVDPATIGYAPVVLAGTSLMMEKSGRPVEVIFTNAVRGILRLDDTHARTFTYTWLKLSADGGEALLSGTDGRLTLLRLQFSDAALGRWGMEDIPTAAAAARITQTLDAGAFSFREGRFRRGPQQATLPDDLTGHSLLFNEAGRLLHARFTGPGTLTVLTESGVTLTGKYSYEPENPFRASLHLRLENARPLELGLHLDSPGVGTFKEIPPVAGGPVTRSGTFTLPDEQEPPPNPNCPPGSLAGLSFVINDSAPCTLTFNADGTGSITKEINGAIQMTTFNYSYAGTGGRTAKVTLTFPGGAGDAIDDYDMTWDNDCTGQFKRESFANGNAAGNGDGTFSPGGLAGLFPALAPGLGL